MRYLTVPISKLKPDPDQPRKYIDQEALQEIAISIKNEGLINPIEVDEKFIIITGERRWRASTMAGLEEIPVKILDKITPIERFIRQVQENIHQNTMTAWDTAEALEKIRKSLSNTAAEVDKRDKKHQGKYFQRGILEIHNLLGIPETTIAELLDLLLETGEIKKALQTPGFQRTKIASIREAPKKYQRGLRHIVATQKNIPRDTVRHIAIALRRADRYGEPDKAEKLLDEKFEGLSTLEALSRINKIIPNEESRVKEPADAVKFISERIIEFMELLEKHQLDSFDEFHQPLVIRDLSALGLYLQTYLQGKSFRDLKEKKALTNGK